MRTFRCMTLAAVLLAAACGDDDAPVPAVTTAPDAGAPAGGGAVPDAGPVAVPLTAWVHDLVSGFGPMSEPDTVDDKVIMDTDDPAAFDPLF
jgi:hypothetical protein